MRRPASLSLPDLLLTDLLPITEDFLLNPLLRSLTPIQQEAVTHVEGPLLILAGPGSGKTRVVTHRVAYLLQQGIPARQILALTFTNKAADEMRNRLEGLAPGESVWMSTFHRFCARLLRDYGSLVGLAENFTIYDTDDSRRVLQRTLEDQHLDTLHFTPDRIAAAISAAKNRMVTAERFEPQPGHPLDAIVAKVYTHYQKRLLKSAAVDFDDLLLHVAQLLRENPEVRRTLDERFRFIMVDEYQDTNLVQYAIVRALSIDHPNLAVTGDPDQSIYGWRGANIHNILNFEQDYPTVKSVRLEQNWRSTKRILRVADELIKHNQQRKPKDLYTENDEGTPVRLIAYENQTVEAESIAGQIAEQLRSGRRKASDFAIFYRVNALSRALEFALRDHGIPFQMVRGLEFYQRKEIKDVISFLQLINNPHDDVAFLRVINTPPRGIGKTTIGRLREHADRFGLTLLEAARESGMIEKLSKKAATNVMKFVAMIDRLREKALAPVEEILGHVLEESGYQKAMEDSDLEEDIDRLANIQELLTDARQFDEQNPGDGQLEAYLEKTSLVNDTDAWDTDNDKVTLMTLHAAKGLEFPVVYIIAVEDGLIPHERSRDYPSQLEEERRLLFVGITRAEEQLQLSMATYREFRGQRRMAVPSQFFMELPREEMEIVEPSYSTAWEAPTAYVPPRRPRPQLPNMPAAVTTAASLMGDANAVVASVSAEQFHQGMVVTHPEYGPGKVVALSGSGDRRTATVMFATAGEKKFVISKSPLRPVGNGKR